MNCVNCKEPMVVLELDQVEIDYCVACGGIWLDSGEIELLLGNQQEVGKILSRPAEVAASKDGGRKCPICRKTMEQFSVGETETLLIDRCRKGHGLWFDKGELKGTLRIFAGESGNKIVRLLDEIFAAASERKEE